MCRDVTQPVAGHSITFGQTVDDDDPVLEIFKLSDAFMFAHEVDVLVDLIRKDIYMRMTAEHLGQGLKFLQRVNGTTRVAWR